MNRIKTAEGRGGRLIAARLLPGSNFVKGLVEVCERHGVRNGALLSCIDSFKKTVFLDPIPRPELKAGYGHGDPLSVDGPIELLSPSGFICHADDGQVLLHVHANMCLADGKAFGGHLTDDGTEVLLTADVLIQEVDGIDMVRRYDDEMQILTFSPTQL
ncbi:MAG: PPC domain-containing DNA-binding protein [Bacillota bacterium]